MGRRAPATETELMESLLELIPGNAGVDQTEHLLAAAVDRIGALFSVDHLAALEDELNVAACDAFPVGYFSELDIDEKTQVVRQLLERRKADS